MTAPSPPRALLVADSFRVRVVAGRAEVRGFHRHLARFTGAVLEVCAEFDGIATHGVNASPAVRAELPDFLAEAKSRIAAYGAGFPRLELWRAETGALEFELGLRPLPELGQTIALRTVGDLQLAHPARKGPHIGAFSALNRELGAEALLQREDGGALEGATTSLVYWPHATSISSATNAASTTSAPDPARGFVIADDRRVPSVTEAVLRAATDQHGAAYTLRGALPSITELHRSELWAINALHGIRPVTHLDGVPLSTPESRRLAWFRDALERGWEPVDAR